MMNQFQFQAKLTNASTRASFLPKLHACAYQSCVATRASQQRDQNSGSMYSNSLGVVNSRARGLLPPCRVTNVGREMIEPKVFKEKNLDQEEYMEIDPDLPNIDPQLLGVEDNPVPMYQYVKESFLDGLISDKVDPVAQQYWFTEPKQGWQTEKRRLKKLKLERFEGEYEDYMYHPDWQTEQRTAIADLKIGTVLKGRVSLGMFDVGAAIDIGCEWDGIIYIKEEEWIDAAKLVPLHAEVEVRVHAIRNPHFYKFPVQLEALGELAELLQPASTYCSPMNLNNIPDDLTIDEIEALTGREMIVDEELEVEDEVDDAMKGSRRQCDLELDEDILAKIDEVASFLV